MILKYIIILTITGVFALAGIMLNVFKWRDPPSTNKYYKVRFKTGVDEEGNDEYEEITFSCMANKDRLEEAEKVIDYYEHAMDITDCELYYVYNITREEYVTTRKKLYVMLNQNISWTKNLNSQET